MDVSPQPFKKKKTSGRRKKKSQEEVANRPRLEKTNASIPTSEGAQEAKQSSRDEQSVGKPDRTDPEREQEEEEKVVRTQRVESGEETIDEEETKEQARFPSVRNTKSRLVPMQL